MAMKEIKGIIFGTLPTLEKCSTVDVRVTEIIH